MVKVNTTKKTRMLRVRLTEHQYQKLKTFAENRGYTVSHVVTEYIRRLSSRFPD